MSLLTKEQVAQYKQTFALFDSDNSGSIDRTELDKVFENSGVQIDQFELDKLVSSIAGGDDKISFEEFIALLTSPVLASRELATLQDLVQDINALQTAFLTQTDDTHQDDLTQIVKILRDSMSTLSTAQVEALIKFHFNQFESIRTLQARKSGKSTSILVRKVLAEEGIPSFFSERFGNPALGGFFAAARATQGLNAHQIIAQLGLDYKGSTFLDASGKVKDVVYVIEAEMEVVDCSVPLDPRVRSKVLEVIKSSSDPEIPTEGQELYDRSHNCAVDDGSDSSNNTPIRLPAPYTGTGFSVNGKNLDGANIEVRFVQELVAIDKAGTKKFIPFPVGTVLYAVGVEGKEVPIAVWNGLDWKLSVNTLNFPTWLPAASGHTVDELLQTWQSAIDLGVAKNPPGAAATAEPIVRLQYQSRITLLNQATSKNLRITERGRVTTGGTPDKRDDWVVVSFGDDSSGVVQLRSGSNSARYLSLTDTGDIISGPSGKYSSFQFVEAGDGWVGIRSVYHTTLGQPLYIGCDNEGQAESKGSASTSEAKFKVTQISTPPSFPIGVPVFLINSETQRLLFQDGPVIKGARGAEGGWLASSGFQSPHVVGADANYYNRAYWRLVPQGEYFLIENLETKRYLFQDGAPIKGDRGAEGGWLASSGFQSPNVVGADANYYNQALWKIVPEGDQFFIENVQTKRYLFQDGPVIKGARGAEGGWLSNSGFQSPYVVGADANYYNRAYWKIVKP